jgi:hypothetical protein
MTLRLVYGPIRRVAPVPGPARDVTQEGNRR